LILARAVFGFDGEKFGLPFDVATHVGTLLAVLAYFRRDVQAMVRSVPDLFRPARPVTGEHVPIDRPDVRPGPEGARVIWLMAIATVPVVMVGLLFTDTIERGARTPEVAAAALAVGAVGLFAAERLGSKRRNEESLTAVEAFWIGCAQAAALVPGVSRSGATITVALFLGLRRAEAARFTFLLGIAAILGAAVYKLRDMLAQGVTSEGALLYLVGTATSALVGYVAVAYLIRFLTRHSLDVFAWYRLALAASVGLWLWRG
jgi:undecaprenyl-diphosphatase